MEDVQLNHVVTRCRLGTPSFFTAIDCKPVRQGGETEGESQAEKEFQEAVIR